MVDNKAAPGGEGLSSWAIDIFRPEDAAGVVELYRAVYGEHYPVRDVYEPAKLIRQGETGDAYRMVARTDAGEVVGHVAFYRSSPPNRNLYECGQLMVRHDCRTSGVAFRLMRDSLAEIPRRHNLEQIWGEAVCNHLVTQHMALNQGFHPTALEVDLMPGESYAKAFGDRPADSGRVSTLVIFRAYRARPQTVYLPEVYGEALRFIYSVLGSGHTFLVSRAELPAEAATRGTVDLFAAAGVARITLSAAGKDLAGYMETAERQATAAGAVVIQVYFPLAWPWTGAVAEALRHRGYFLGGALPRWFDDDGLLLQKVLAEPNFAGINLYRKQAKQILDLVKQDWLASRSQEERTP